MTDLHTITDARPLSSAGLPLLTEEELAAANAKRMTPEAAQAYAAAEAERRDSLPLVNSQAELPAFANEDEEVVFWDTHEPGPGLEEEARRRMAAGTFPSLPPIDPSRLRPTSPPKQAAPVSLRLEADTVRRLRALAEKKGTKYQTLLKQFVIERLYEEEKREHVVG